MFKILNNRAVVLATVIIFIIIASIIVVSALMIMTSDARLTEREIERMNAIYAAKAAIQVNLMREVQNLGNLNPVPVDGINVTFTEAPPGPPDNTQQWDATVNY